MNAIQIPPKTQARLVDLVQAINALQGQINAIEATLRETLDVPDDYILRDVLQGFVPAQQVPELPQGPELPAETPGETSAA